MVSVMSAETNELNQKRMEQAVREAQPATKADIDRLHDELRRMQDQLSVMLRQGDGGSGGATNESWG